MSGKLIDQDRLRLNVIIGEKMFKKIILAFKFSSACRSALETAIKLAMDNDSELLIFHALDYRLKDMDHQDPKLIKINQKMKQKFEIEIKPHLADFPKFKFGYSPTDPSMEICKIAHHIQADLILLGCHEEPGRPKLARLDYVGLTILEKAPCPVMLIPP
jgi:nucleotide-binding universal stress UspA family protein